MLGVQELTKCFGRRIAVDRVSFEIKAGEIVGYLGPNGAGKSTTVKMIMGMLKPSRGQILLNGRPIQKSPEDFKMRVGYIPEEAVLYSHLSGYEYLQLVGRLRNLNERDMTLKIKALLRLCEVLPIV